MIQTITIHSDNKFRLYNFLEHLEVSLQVEMEGYDESHDYYYLLRPEFSTSMFLIAYNRKDEIEISIDMLASYDDYRFFPFLADSINIYMNGSGLKIEGKRVYDVYDENWIADCIGEEIALLKSSLSVFPKYYPELPLKLGTYVSIKQLADFGVNLHSSTPRIYGYIQYIIKKGLALTSSEDDIMKEQERFSELADIEVDVPQHISIGRVKSWQIDGSETWESYSKEDVDMLMELESVFLRSEAISDSTSISSCKDISHRTSDVYGVVMNDIGTIYQEGIGVERNGEKAVFWFKEAIAHGDRLYAASNLGDLYRKGCGNISVSLPKAFDAYMQSVDYYAMYRVGQAYEEGWIGEPDMDEAMKWYKKAAIHGHHLALKRLSR